MHGAEEIDDLPRGRRKVLGSACFHLAGNAVEALLQQSTQTPACAVAREHVQIVNMEVSLTVALTDLGRVHEIQPVVGNHLARDIENQAAQTVALIGVGIDAPIRLIEVFVDRAFNIHPAFFCISVARTLFAINDVGAKRFEMPRFVERVFDGILHLLDMGSCYAELAQTRHHERVGDFLSAFAAELIGCLAGAFDGVDDFVNVKILDRTVAFDDVLDLYCHFLCTFVVVI